MFQTNTTYVCSLSGRSAEQLSDAPSEVQIHKNIDKDV